ncbi:hypothetical protein ABH917_002658 [Thermobifida halotolerans]
MRHGRVKRRMRAQVSGHGGADAWKRSQSAVAG